MDHLHQFTLAAALTLGSLSSAQTVFTPATAVPAFGTYEFTERYRDTQPASPIDTNATSGVWDFSATTFPGTPGFEVSILPATATEHHSEFPTADICRIDHFQWGAYYYYFRNGPDSLTYLGEVTILNGDPEVYLQPACRKAPFLYPAQVGDIHTEDVTDCQGPINGLPQSWRRRILATGTFISSVIVVENATLVMDHLDSFNHMTTPPTPLRSTRFHWFRPGNALEPVATWFPGEDVVNMLFIKTLIPVVGVEEHDAGSTVALFPNPATDRITLQSRDGNALGDVSIHAADGRMVLSAGTVLSDRPQLEVRNLTPGLYTVRILSDGHVQALRFVKE
jgi:hypothetical protein